MKFTPKAVHQELLREFEMRKHVYSRRVIDGKMTGRDADRKIALMEQAAEMIAAKYDIEGSEERQADLLGGNTHA